MALAVVTRIRSLAEAQIAAGALRSAGFAAEVFDTSFGGLEAPVIESLGGYRIMAPEHQALDARRFLADLKASPPAREPEDTGPWAPEHSASPPVGDSEDVGPWATRSPEIGRLKRRGMRLLALAVLGTPLLIWLLRMLFR